MNVSTKRFIGRSWERNYYIPLRVRREVTRRDNFICVFCGLEGIKSLCHLIPLCRGGNNHAENLAVCCKGCCREKRFQLPLEFFFNGFWGACDEVEEEGLLTKEKANVLKEISSLIEGILELQRGVQRCFERGEGEEFVKDIEKFMEVQK